MLWTQKQIGPTDKIRLMNKISPKNSRELYSKEKGNVQYIGYFKVRMAVIFQ